ncbi:hypothetical protein A6D70_30290 [Klebsiella pneumoniae]|nr:hypothetical protein A6D70_30290 [Klebsiella pneumoniae]
MKIVKSPLARYHLLLLMMRNAGYCKGKLLVLYVIAMFLLPYLKKKPLFQGVKALQVQRRY